MFHNEILKKMSPQTASLKKQVENICGAKVQFRSDESIIHYATCGFPDNIPIVKLNPDKMNGHIDLLVNHELHHIKISKENYSILVYEINNESDHEFDEIQNLVRSVIEHPIIQQRQVATGILDEEFQQLLTKNVIRDLRCNDSVSLEKLKNSLHYVDRILLCKDVKLKKLFIKKFNDTIPNSQRLGEYLLNIYCKWGGSTGGKESTREILIEWGGILEGYTQRQWRVKNPN
jgi:hypothetical protein